MIRLFLHEDRLSALVGFGVQGQPDPSFFADMWLRQRSLACLRADAACFLCAQGD